MHYSSSQGQPPRDAENAAVLSDLQYQRLGLTGPDPPYVMVSEIAWWKIQVEQTSSEMKGITLASFKMVAVG